MIGSETDVWFWHVICLLVRVGGFATYLYYDYAGLYEYRHSTGLTS